MNQYVVRIKLSVPDMDWLVNYTLRGYSCFCDIFGNLDESHFNKTNLPNDEQLIFIRTPEQTIAKSVAAQFQGVRGFSVLETIELKPGKDFRALSV